MADFNASMAAAVEDLTRTHALGTETYASLLAQQAGSTSDERMLPTASSMLANAAAFFAAHVPNMSPILTATNIVASRVKRVVLNFATVALGAFFIAPVPVHEWVIEQPVYQQCIETANRHIETAATARAAGMDVFWKLATLLRWHIELIIDSPGIEKLPALTAFMVLCAFVFWPLARLLLTCLMCVLHSIFLLLGKRAFVLAVPIFLHYLGCYTRSFIAEVEAEGESTSSWWLQPDAV